MQAHLQHIKMREIFTTAIVILFLTSYGYCQSGKNHPERVQTTRIKGQGNAIDTIIKKKIELSFNKFFPNNYKRDDSVLQSLRPYFVSQIVDPTNLSHHLYLDRVEVAQKKLSAAKANLLERMNASRGIREKLAKVGIANKADLNSITFVYIPVYYLTPNIVFFKNGENIAKYYNLGRGNLLYLMLRNHMPIGYLNFHSNDSDFKSYFFPMHLNDTESYIQTIKMGKIPIGIAHGISLDEKAIGSISMFGYVDQGHIVFSYYEEGGLQNIGMDGYVDPDPRFIKAYTLETAESFFFEGGGNSIINQWLENTVNSLKKRL